MYQVYECPSIVSVFLETFPFPMFHSHPVTHPMHTTVHRQGSNGDIRPPRFSHWDTLISVLTLSLPLWSGGPEFNSFP